MRIILLYILLLSTTFSAYATHLRAANITLRQISGKKYNVQLVVYTDDKSVVDGPGGVGVDVSETKLKIFEIDKNDLINEREITVSRLGGAIPIGNGTFKNIYSLDFDFPNASGNYLISFLGVNRNNGILNIQSPSDQQALYVETFVSLSSSTVNQSFPQLLIDPIDLGNVNQPYTYNCGAWDIDGDSLSYKLVVAQNSRGNEVSNYRFPDHPAFGSSSLSIDPVSGTIKWDSPREPGVYNLAIMIEEWQTFIVRGQKQKIRSGYVIRDMQIIIEDSENEAPVILLPKDTCVASGVQFKDTIIIYDPNGNPFTQSIKGELLKVDNIANFVAIGNNRADSNNLLFQWTPSCNSIRKQPYVAILKATDVHPTPLTTINDFTITVGGKAPVLISTKAAVDSVLLEWEPYECKDKASKLNVWRRECDASSVKRDACTFGVPEEWGFEKVVSISPNATSYTDDNGGKGLSKGLKYCYLLDVEFNNTQESYASNISCANLPLSTSLITSASVVETDTLKGQVKVDWIAPLDVSSSVTAPFTYKLFRGSTLVYNETSSMLTGGSFVDTLLDTKSKQYVYTIELIANGTQVGVSSAVSTVFLGSDIAPKTLSLKWEASTGIQNLDSLYDYVYEVRNNDTILLDSVPANTFRYQVSDLVNGKEYCFLVKKSYTACNDSLKEVFSSWSNLHCSIPVDTIPPCTPILSIVDPFCDLFQVKSSYVNRLTWETSCEQETQYYAIYYKSELEASFEYVDKIEVPLKSYNHAGLESIKGCYRIKAVDGFGNESQFSNQVCQDNCEYYELPNVLTPNDDGKNDFFRPYPEPRFVSSVEFVVFNRWGERVFVTNDIKLNWEGVNTEGNKLVDGVYYFEANIEFDKLFEEDKQKTIKGWVSIIR